MCYIITMKHEQLTFDFNENNIRKDVDMEAGTDVVAMSLAIAALATTLAFVSVIAGTLTVL